MLADDTQSVRVALRLRPAIVEGNGGEHPKPVRIQVVPDSAQIIIGKEKRPFTFDDVFLPDISQVALYESVVAPLIGQFLQGFNVTVFAYGQTYSGKTYTMGSDNNMDTPEEIWGVIPRAIRDIFDKLENDTCDGTYYQMRVSFLEIYQEQIRDLLMPEVDPRDISIRESKGQIIVSGVHEERVQTIEDMLKCLEKGGQSRSTGGTQMNTHSSRSHAIFSVTLEQKMKRRIIEADIYHQSEEDVVIRRSKLHLVDLAGSERLKRTGAEGIRLKESVKINSGLLALGNVISILGQDIKPSNINNTPSEKDRHVPYRDSKLTRLLQDSLGGNSKTLMIACVSPLEDDVEESLNTLKYANRARKIRNKPVVNIVDERTLELNTMQSKIEQLQEQLKERESNPASQELKLGNFDDPQWMIIFMEELKNRTLRGANAIRDLEAAEAEKATLQKELLQTKEIIEFNHEEKEELQNQIRCAISEKEQMLDKYNLMVTDLRQTGHELEITKKDRNQSLEACARLISGETLNESLDRAARELIAKYLPHFVLKEIAQHTNVDLEHIADDVNEVIKATSGFLPPISESPTKTSIPSPSKIPARIFRRKFRKASSESLADSTSFVEKQKAEIKSLEDELFEAQKEIKELKAQLESKIVEEDKQVGEAKLLSVKVLQESSSQTDLNHQTSDDVNDDKADTPQEIPQENLGLDEKSQLSPLKEDQIETAKESSSLMDLERYQNASYEDLVQDLSAAIKAKVDLLKDLSKASKESERMRHQLSDKIQKLERELEASERELSKALEESREKDATKDKIKEEYERKVKHYEGLLAKSKIKQKEQEKIVKDKESADRKIQELLAEVEKLNSQISALKRKIKDDNEKYAEQEARKAKELASVNKQLEDTNKKVRQADNLNENLRKKLDRKTEEISSLNRKLKDSQVTHPLGQRSARSSFHELPKAASTEFSSLKKPDGDSSMEMDQPEKAPDEAKIKNTVDTIEKLDLELGKTRSKLDTLESKLHDLESTPKKSDSLQELKKRRALLLHKVVRLRSDKRKLEESLDPNPKGEEEDDLDYDALLKEFEDDVEILEIIPTIRTGRVSELRHLIVINLRELSHLRKQLAQEKEQSLKNKAESEEQNQKLALKLQKAIKSYEKKLASLDEKKESEKQTESKEILGDDTQAVKDVDALEKDLFYYRQTNKDLKAKLRELVARNQKLMSALKSSATTAATQMATAAE